MRGHGAGPFRWQRPEPNGRLYDWRKELTEIPGSKEYFNEIDRRFLTSVRKYMPWRAVPFEQLIPFDALRDKDVLEIGVGHGTHAQLISPRCRSFTGIDLTGYAVEMTSKRLRLFNIPGKVLEMDAEQMSFPTAASTLFGVGASFITRLIPAASCKK